MSTPCVAMRPPRRLTSSSNFIVTFAPFEYFEAPPCNSLKILAASGMLTWFVLRGNQYMEARIAILLREICGCTGTSSQWTTTFSASQMWFQHGLVCMYIRSNIMILFLSWTVLRPKLASHPWYRSSISMQHTKTSKLKPITNVSSLLENTMDNCKHASLL